MSNPLEDVDLLGSSNYDIVDTILGGVFGYGAITLLEMGTSTIEGVSFSDTAFSVGSTGIPFYLIAVIGAVLGAYISNDGLSLSSLQNRPTWEKVAAGSTIGLPLGIHFFSDINSLFTGSIEARVASLALLVVGYLIVGYRRMTTRKRSLGDVADPRNYIGE